jgi:hypothetical protein
VLGRAGIMASLARWLGPLTPATEVPTGVRRSRVRVQGKREVFDAWVYQPSAGRVRGALLLLPGLHYLGPADPRLDRFNRVLARSGVLVLSPFLPSFARLHVNAALGPDAIAAYDTLTELPAARGLRPGVFSISTGSLPAARVCAARDVGGWVVFGGYHDFAECVRFSLTSGGGVVPADPLNRPVVYLNLLPFMPDTPADTAPLERALRRYVEQTWGRAEMKVNGTGARSRTAWRRSSAGPRAPSSGVPRARTTPRVSSACARSRHPVTRSTAWIRASPSRAIRAERGGARP